MAKESEYRKQIREQIKVRLARLPFLATQQEVLLALAEVGRKYRGPAGSGTSWLYKCYLKERQIALRLGMNWTARPVVLCLPKGVFCGWCGFRRGGCIQCAQARARHAATNWEGWDQAVLDTETQLILADWLEEKGFLTEAAYYREVHP